MPPRWQLYVDDAGLTTASVDRRPPKPARPLTPRHTRNTSRWRPKGPLAGYIAIGGSVIIAILIVVVAAGGSGKQHPAAGSTQTPALTPPVSPPVISSITATPTPVPSSPITAATAASTPRHIDLDAQGTAAVPSTAFTATGRWILNYDFDCKALGHSSSFAVVIYRPTGTVATTAVKTVGLVGDNAVDEELTGAYYLKVESACTWHIVITH
jgi:hypothetical protein